MDASHVRLQKRFQAQSQECEQSMVKAEKDFKKMIDHISETHDTMEASYTDVIAEAQARGSLELLDEFSTGKSLFEALEPGGAITKISTGKCTENDLKPVLQVIDIDSRAYTKDNKQWYAVVLSDGSFWQLGLIAGEIFILNKLQEGSIVQLNMFQLKKFRWSKFIKISYILVCDLKLLRSQRDIIGDPKLYPRNETPLVERTTPTIPCEDQNHANSHHVEEPPTSKQNQDHVDSLLNENIDDSISRHVEEPPTSKQKPSTSTQKCSSDSPTQNKKRKLQSSDDIISLFGKDISTHVSMIVEKTIEDGLGACYKTLGTLEEGVLKMTKLMMEKSKEVDAGFKKLETLEEDVFKMTKLMMEKSKEVDAGLKKLETLEEDVSKLMKLTMEKNKEDVAGFKKLETLEEDVSKLTKLMMEKNKEDVLGFKKLETLGEDVSKMAKMMMEKNKEDDIGACIEKLDKIGWVPQDPMYDTAILLFGQSADYRKLWLHLKPENCGNWVKNAGSMFGLLD